MTEIDMADQRTGSHEHWYDDLIAIDFGSGHLEALAAVLAADEG